jgi:hypothetical protein
MNAPAMHTLSAEQLSELERKFFWWDSVSGPRSEDRILAQAMEFASFDDVRRLEETVGPHRLVEVMRNAAAGWISDRSWEFWRGRLAHATGVPIPEEPPRRLFDDGPT